MRAKISALPTRADRVRDFLREILVAAADIRKISIVTESTSGVITSRTFDCSARDVALHALLLQNDAADTPIAD